MKKPITIIDYGVGNLYSVEKAFARLGADAVVTSDPETILGAAKVVLPGVGAFGDCMRNLTECGLAGVVRAVVAKGTPLLGICVGLQILFAGSEEDPEIPGLRIFPGLVRRIVAPGLKIPHMGWNSLDIAGASPLLAGLPANPYVYFVHSYHAVPDDPSLVTATTEYGGRVTAAVSRGNIHAVQFHPEKSGDAGLKILANFKEIA